MVELVATAERLRQVRKANERFLALWAADCLLGRREGLDNLNRDALLQDLDKLTDPFNHDWSLLYRGSVLDD